MANEEGGEQWAETRQARRAFVIQPRVGTTLGISAGLELNPEGVLSIGVGPTRIVRPMFARGVAKARVMKNRLTALGGKDRVDQDAGK